MNEGKFFMLMVAIVVAGVCVLATSMNAINTFEAINMAKLGYEQGTTPGHQGLVWVKAK